MKITQISLDPRYGICYNKGMKVVLFFTSASRHSCRKRLNGAQRYFKDTDIQVQVVERNYHKVNVRKLLDFWKPVGCIAECGSGAEELSPKLFGKLPVVYLDEDPAAGLKNRFTVNPDIAESATIAAKQLLSFGFDSYAFVGFKKPLFWSIEREKVFASAIELNSRQCHIFKTKQSGDVHRIEALQKWIAELPKPCGLFAAFDGTAEEVLAAARQAGVKVPDELVVLSVDNDEEICENCNPSLSSICPDFEKAGYLCAELLDLQLNNPSAKPESRTYGIIGIVKRRSTALFAKVDAKVTNAVEYIRLHANERISTPDVVAQMGCSRRTAEMRFKNLTGKTIQDEIRDVRMANCMALLRRPNQSIDGIAHLCGYYSDSTLRYAFKARMGMSMSEWRRKNVK